MIRIANLPIFRRLFLAFFLAALIPGIVIIVITSIFVHALNAQGVGSSQTTPILIGAIIAVLITTIIVVTIGFFVNITITRPLRHLSALTRRIAKGDTSARAVIATRDEISMVASSMNNMLDNIVLLIQQTQAQRDGLLRQVEKLVSEVSGVGEGDLRIQAEVTSDALGVLADSFNYMVEELSSLIVRVKAVAHEVEHSTTMTYEHMVRLVEVADAQLQQIALVDRKIEQMVASSRRVSERAHVLLAVAHETRQSAETGRQAVRLTIESMERIGSNVQETAEKVRVLGDRSREIDDIVEVIQTLAHQTNRLALDANIQAAMAGVNGQGFAAVAVDIRRLAERAKEQGASISRIIRAVRDDIGAVVGAMQETRRETVQGVHLAAQGAQSLESIFTVVEQQGREIETINQMIRQQLESSNAAVEIMQAVSTATQQSGDSTRSTAQNMERLARLAEQLLASVEAFKLREDTPLYVQPLNTPIPLEEPQKMDSLMANNMFRTISGDLVPQQFGSGESYQAAPPRTSLSQETQRWNEKSRV